MANETILVADDTSAVRQLIRLLLERHGYRVIEAADGDESLHVVESEKPDLVLLDYRMPALDGMQVLQELHRKCIPTKVIIVSRWDWTLDDIIALIRAGACDYIQKPCDPPTLIAKVKRALALDTSINIKPLSDASPLIQDLIVKAKEREKDSQDNLRKASDLSQAVDLLQKKYDANEKEVGRLRDLLAASEARCAASSKKAGQLSDKLESLQAKHVENQTETVALKEKLSALQALAEKRSIKSQFVQLAIRLIYLVAATLVAAVLHSLGIVSTVQSLVVLPVVIFILLLLPLERVRKLQAKHGKKEAKLELDAEKH